MRDNRIPMIQIDDTIVSVDCLTEKFCCDLEACKGACCIEGDAGAPVDLDEVAELEEALPVVWPMLSASAQAVIDRQGVVYTDEEGDLVTSIVNGKDCVFTCYSEDGTCYCALEKAYREGKTRFYKPLSCHLYPIRLKRIGDCVALNYNRWDVCKMAVVKGRQLDLPVYRFLKAPLVRRFGEAWYAELEDVVEELKRQNMI
ncbi:MAG: DUF3109 family protein [Clostridium sp.]|nr:DUF3109 family protein [Clostridium sp.]